VQEDAPLAFVPTSWLSYVLDDKDKIVRRYYEISTLWELLYLAQRLKVIISTFLHTLGDIA